MHRKIALEEHFATEDTVGNSKQFMPEDHWSELRARLLDFHDKRLGFMDRHGVERMIVSLNAPAVQAIPDLHRAIEVARRANDCLAGQISRRPDRFAGLAALPMQMRRRQSPNCGARYKNSN
jgi:predicted TIM-barrel fold metal-dependent hydrolase